MSSLPDRPLGWLAGVAVSLCLFVGLARPGEAPGALPPTPPAGVADVPEAEQPAAYFGALAQLKRSFGMPSAACALYRQAVERAKSPTEKAEFQIGLAEATEATGDRAAAGTMWAELMKSPDPVAAGRAQLHLALALAEEGQADKAIGLLEKVALASPIQLFRRSAASHLARLLLRRPERAAKLAQYRESMQREPRRREWLDLVLALQADDPRGRVETWKLALAAGPRDPDVLRGYPNASLEAGLLDEAETQYRSLMENYPSETQLACEKLALIAVRKGHPDDAERLVLQGAAQIAEGVQKDLHLARQYLAIGLWPPAEKWARQAVAQARGDAMKAAAEMELGEALVRLGKSGEALSLLKPLAAQTLWDGLRTRAAKLVHEMAGQEPAKDPGPNERK